MRVVLPAAFAVLVVAAFHSPRHTGAPTASTLRVAQQSVVKVTGTAECQLEIEGSGFVYAPKRVMTNAHVVAGVREPQIITQDKRTLRGRVVLYDPRRDVAVINVPGLHRPPLQFADTVRTRDGATVAGFPEDGPFVASGARIRSKQTVRDSDIYDTASITLEIYTVRGRVRHGNSGGPLLSPEGKVYGVVFAMALPENRNTGYALTAKEVLPDAKAGESNNSEVSTLSCPNEN